MTELDKYYASGGDDRFIQSIEITNGATSIYIVDGWQDMTLGLGNNDGSALFTAWDMTNFKPQRTEDVTQDYSFTIPNVNGQASAFITDNIANDVDVEIKRRVYRSSDLSNPLYPPEVYVVKSGTFSIEQSDITAGYFNVLDFGYPRKKFDTDDYPALAYV